MKYAHVLQHSKEDCGAACLASITKYYGRNFTLNQIREVVGTGQFGTTLLGLKRGAERLGFNARPVKTSPEVLKRINEAPLPAIIHWKGHHWVVLYGNKGKKCVVADPAVGLRYLSPQDLAEGWADWLMLLLEPDPIRFYAQENHRIGSFWGFFKRIWNFRGILAQALPLNCLLGLLALASPFLLQILTDDVLVRGDTKLLTTIAIAVVVMNVISSSLSWVQSNLIAHFAHIENFRLGAPYLTFEQIVRASQVTEADDFISKLPNKYQTIVGEFGANLSGGQRQRLAIARAIVTDPPVLILDESTSGLDPVSEARVLDRLLKHRHGKTTILISHRPQVINRADWIVLLDQGKLKIQGSLVQLRYQSGEHLKFLNP